MAEQRDILPDSSYVACFNPVEWFLALPGIWSQQRTLKPGGIYRGTAEFSWLATNSLCYREEGQLTLDDGLSMAAMRGYVYRLEGQHLAVYFEEDPIRHFHTLNFDSSHEAVATAYHRCGDDDYQTTYRFYSRDYFVIRHDVSGPRKAYSSTTAFLRQKS